MTQLNELGSDLDQESWSWLDVNHPTIADSVALSVNRGATPDDIYKFVVRRLGSHRADFARRCEAAARHLESVKTK